MIYVVFSEIIELDSSVLTAVYLVGVGL